MYIILKRISVADSATYWFLAMGNWVEMGRRRTIQVQTFLETMQYVYDFIGRHGIPASQPGCTDIFRIYAIFKNQIHWDFFHI